MYRDVDNIDARMRGNSDEIRRKITQISLRTSQNGPRREREQKGAKRSPPESLRPAAPGPRGSFGRLCGRPWGVLWAPGGGQKRRRRRESWRSESSRIRWLFAVRMDMGGVKGRARSAREGARAGHGEHSNAVRWWKVQEEVKKSRGAARTRKCKSRTYDLSMTYHAISSFYSKKGGRSKWSV